MHCNNRESKELPEPKPDLMVKAWVFVIAATGPLAIYAGLPTRRRAGSANSFHGTGRPVASRAPPDRGLTGGLLFGDIIFGKPTTISAGRLQR